MHGKKDIWFIYDGECPLCSRAATALRIKEHYGNLHLLNAREALEHEIIQDINARGLDLDEGMIIFDGDQYYHGKDALRFMACYGERKGLFNLANKILYRSDTMAALAYPKIRSVRNYLIRKKNTPPIDNLNRKEKPIFKSVFGEEWQALPEVIKKHYANRPFTEDVVTVEGILEVECFGPMKLFAPILWRMSGIPPHNEKDVPVTVRFESDKNSQSFHFNRMFYFKKRDTYNFHSRMINTQDSEVIEFMRYGLCWRMEYLWQDGKVKLKHKGYSFNLLGQLIPLPFTLLFGEGNAEEIAVDDNTFDMFVEVSHPFWGKIYGYKGRFKIKNE